MGIISAAPLTMYPHIYKRLGYDIATDLTPVAPVCSLSFVVMVGPAVSAEVTNFTELVRWLKANPDKATFGSPGTGSLPHFVGSMLAKEVGINWLHVPYTGAAPAMQDLLGGRLPVYLGVSSNAVPHKESKDVRTVAITAPRRLEQLPTVPTMRELGHPSLEVVEWVGIFVPKATPEATVRALAGTIVKAQATEEVRNGLARIGFDMLRLSESEFANLIKQDTARWAAIVKETGFKTID
jgi:tripartite-type tricarboxylate transporter receptor subunit TctC